MKRLDSLRLAARWIPYLLLPATVLYLYRPALAGSFVLDDWELLGPRAAAEFLANPLSIFGSYQVVHYAPVARLFYALLSVLFGADPFPYHAVCLALLAVSGVLLYRYLLFLGVSPLPALFGAVYFSAAVSHLQVAMWITTVNYILLGIFLVLGLWQWETYQRGGGRKPLALALLFAFLAQYTHTLGVLLPVLLLFRAALPGGAARAVPRRAALPWGAAALGGVLALQLLPRLLIPGAWTMTKLNTAIPSFLNSFAVSLLVVIGPGFHGQGFQEYCFGSLFSPRSILPAAALAGLTVLVALLWVVHRNHWRLLATGLLIVLGAWILPLLLIPDPQGFFPLRGRYQYIPNLGFAFVLAALFDLGTFLQGCKVHELCNLARTSPKKILPLVALGLFLYQASWNISVVRGLYLAQDHFVRDSAQGYAMKIQGAMRISACGEITVYDTLLRDAKPASINGDYYISFLSHATIHRFYFGDRPGMMSRVRFVPCRNDPSHLPPPRDCAFLAWGPDLYPLK